MPKHHVPINEEDLRLSDPSIWPFQTITGPAEIYIARGAALVYLQARRRFAKELEANTLETTIRTSILPSSGWPLKHARDLLCLRHAIAPETPREDTKDWLHQVYEALLRNVPPRRSTSLYVTLLLSPSGSSASLRMTHPWW